MILRHGGDGVRLELIADEAGVSPNTVRYYYGNLDELVEDVHRRAIARFYAARLATIECLDDPVEQLAAMIRGGVPTTADDEDWVVLSQTYALARRSRLQLALMNALYHQQVALYLAVLEAGSAHGVFRLRERPVTIARTLVALEDKLGLLVIWRDAIVGRDEALRLLAAYAGLATGVQLDLALV
jgi:AcrR family transcriptional regulator